MTTFLKVLGREYDIEAATTRAELNVLVFMTKRLGITMKEIIGGLRSVDTNADPLELMSTEGTVDAIRGLIWLARTQAKERTPDGRFFTLDEANEGIGLLDLQWVSSEDETAPKEPEAEPAESSTSSTT